MKHAKSLCVEIVEKSQNLTVDNEKIFDLLQNQPDISWMMTPNATGLWFNKAWCDFSGRTIEDMREWAWQDHLPLEEIPRAASSFYHAFSTGQNWECIFPQRGVEGVYRTFLGRAVPLYNSKGEIQYWLGNETDITDYVGAERRMRR